MIYHFTRMQWKDVVAMAADVARNGFNVTHDLGKSTVVQITKGSDYLPLGKNTAALLLNLHAAPKQNNLDARETLALPHLNFLSLYS